MALKASSQKATREPAGSITRIYREDIFHSASRGH